MSNFQDKSNFISNLSNFLSEGDKDLLSQLEIFIQQYKKQRQTTHIPLRLFAGKLAPLEVIVKYLYESGLTYAEIARILNRDQRTIWVTYSKAIKKEKKRFEIKNDDILIDIRILSNKKTPLQSIISYLKERGYNLKQIASMLNRSYKNIWMIHNEK